MVLSCQNIYYNIQGQTKKDIFEYRAYPDPKLYILGCLKEYLPRRKQKISIAGAKKFYNNEKAIPRSINR